MGETKLGKRTHEVRVGMAVYWAETWPATIEGMRGHHFSAINGKVGGWSAGARSEALVECREALLAREALHRVVVKQDAAE